jgi:hypothetical protein
MDTSKWYTKMAYQCDCMLVTKKKEYCFHFLKNCFICYNMMYAFLNMCLLGS